jgi:hypothetical protein
MESGNEATSNVWNDLDQNEHEPQEIDSPTPNVDRRGNLPGPHAQENQISRIETIPAKEQARRRAKPALSWSKVKVRIATAILAEFQYVCETRISRRVHLCACILGA